MRAVQHEAIESGFLDLPGTDASSLEEVKLTDTAKTLKQLAAMYAGLIAEKADAVDASSSGRMQDTIQPTELEYNGSIISIGVEAIDYMSYVDAGVNGWAKNRGSIYNFKAPKKRAKGEKFTGTSPLVESIKEYLKREGGSARNVQVGISARESKGMDALTKNAISVAYMIKRQGIKPKHFFRDATKEMEVVIRNELGVALRIDIINNIVK
jgi:hypothetical protein